MTWTRRPNGKPIYGCISSVCRRSPSRFVYTIRRRNSIRGRDCESSQAWCGGILARDLREELITPIPKTHVLDRGPCIGILA